MTDTKKNISTEGYRGTRDFFPEDQRARVWLFETMRQVLSRFGYDEYSGPILEPLELYAAKSSEEIVAEQLYSFTDRGDRKVAIRPEMTPTLARMVASKVRELRRPIRWFSIPTCMRYERPQRGRLREFDQLNVDVFGGQALDEDIEIILTCVHLMQAMQANSGDYEIKLNHRSIVNQMMHKSLGLSQDGSAAFLRLLDKKDKLDPKAFQEAAAKLGLDPPKIKRVEDFMAASLDEVESVLGEPCQAAKDLKERITLLEETAPAGRYVYSPEIMRGFDYYTGLVFEIFDTDPKNRRALFGGGRYDNLVGDFGVDALPGIGYGVSDVSLLNFLETHGKTPWQPKRVDVSVIRFSEADRKDAHILAEKLRALGLAVEAPITAAKFGKQIQTAEKSGAKCVAFIGEDEKKTGSFAVKWLASGEQEVFKQEDCAKLAAKFK